MKEGGCYVRGCKGKIEHFHIYHSIRCLFWVPVSLPTSLMCKEYYGGKADKKMNIEEHVKGSAEQRNVDKGQILEILNRAFRDDIFCIDLLERGEMILNNYSMSREAKSAILSGDINWIRQNVGELTSGQSTYLMYRLEIEKNIEDKVLAKHIVSELRRNSIINENPIDVKVKNRIVTISGIVPNRYTHMAVYNTAQCTKGVMNVIDMLKVE